MIIAKLLASNVPDPDPPDPHILDLPDSDSLVRVIDPAPDQASKNKNKSLDSYCFTTSFGLP